MSIQNVLRVYRQHARMCLNTLHTPHTHTHTLHYTLHTAHCTLHTTPHATHYTPHPHIHKDTPTHIKGGGEEKEKEIKRNRDEKRDRNEERREERREEMIWVKKCLRTLKSARRIVSMFLKNSRRMNCSFESSESYPCFQLFT